MPRDGSVTVPARATIRDAVVNGGGHTVVEQPNAVGGYPAQWCALPATRGRVPPRRVPDGRLFGGDAGVVTHTLTERRLARNFVGYVLPIACRHPLYVVTARQITQMTQPYGRCQRCGERLYAHIQGGYQCLNCDRQYTDAEFENRTA